MNLIKVVLTPEGFYNTKKQPTTSTHNNNYIYNFYNTHLSE